MAVGPVPGGAPSPAQLRAAARALFSGSAPAESGVHTALAAQYPAALLRFVLDQRDKGMLSAALRSGFFSPDLSSRLARENPSIPYPLRLLLTHPALADSTASTPAGSSAAGQAGDTDRMLERWQFSIGIAYPFLRNTVTQMPREPDGKISFFGTDGLSFFFRTGEPVTIRQADFYHMILHCIFRHMIPPAGAIRQLWDIACDMACEFLRCELFPSADGTDLRFAVAGALPEGTDRRSAASIYKALLDLFDDELPDLQRRFCRDDHRYWYEPFSRSRIQPLRNPGRGLGYGEGESGDDALSLLRREAEERWQPLTEQFLPKKSSRHSYGLAPGSREERLILRQEGRHDFTRYLRRYSVLREEMQLDESSFDYIYYCYGLERYGNLPFIEPLEYTESYKIEELVIAIDTSGSCTLEIVERFLAEIERILMQKENFFRKMHIHIVQCDSIIQDHTEIRSPEQWKRYLKDLKIKGRGGTSFIPVFTLVEKLREQGRIKDLKGLMYFTDGDGAYPPKKPDYETAFVFPGRESLERTYPDWIVPLCLES